MKITDLETPWPDEISLILIRHGIIHIEQVLRIIELEQGYYMLSKLTESPIEQWKEWQQYLPEFPQNIIKLAPIDKDKLLSFDMVSQDIEKNNSETDINDVEQEE